MTAAREPENHVVRVSDMQLAATDPQVVITGADFEQFYRTAYTNVARALGITLGDRQLGAEAADEAMARSYAHWEKVRHYDNPAGWAYRVGLNWARSVRRRLAHRPHVPEAAAVEQPPVADPQIHQAIGELPIDLRSVVVCRFILDWSVEETAEALALRPGTVKSRTHRAVSLLQASLEHYRKDH